MTRQISSGSDSMATRTARTCSTVAPLAPAKPVILLMAAVQYVQYPHYRALILRKTYADLSLPGAVMDRAIDLVGWSGRALGLATLIRRATFPSGASVYSSATIASVT